MNISSPTKFFKDLTDILVCTIDGLTALLWCLFFFSKAVYFFTQRDDLWATTENLLLVPVILLFVIRLRINRNAQEKLNIGSLISVNVLAIVFLLRG